MATQTELQAAHDAVVDLLNLALRAPLIASGAAIAYGQQAALQAGAVVLPPGWPATFNERAAGLLVDLVEAWRRAAAALTPECRQSFVAARAAATPFVLPIVDGAGYSTAHEAAVAQLRGRLCEPTLRALLMQAGRGSLVQDADGPFSGLLPIDSADWPLDTKTVLAAMRNVVIDPALAAECDHELALASHGGTAEAATKHDLSEPLTLADIARRLSDGRRSRGRTYEPTLRKMAALEPCPGRPKLWHVRLDLLPADWRRKLAAPRT